MASNPIKSAAAVALLAGAGLLGSGNLITKYEGWSDHVYLDPLGIPTICRGATDKALTSLKVVTAKQCDDADVKNILAAAETVKRCAGPDVGFTLGELNAWTSFAYNVGPGGRGKKDGFCMLKSGKQPTLLRLIKEGKPRAACKQLFAWTQPGTKIHNGIKARRTEEYALCVRDLPEDSP